MPETATINVKELNGVFLKNFAQKKNDLMPKAAQKQEALGFAGLDIDDTVDTVCEAWPKIKPFLDLAMRAFGLVFPTRVAMARALFTALDEKLFPLLCKRTQTEGP